MDKLNVKSMADIIVMIQTDKPVYKPNDILRYQIVALDGASKPIELNHVQVEIFDAKDNLVSSSDFTEITKPLFGFHQNELIIGEEPNVGTWTIKVKINNQNVITEKNFGVRPYNLPLFQVNIDAPSRISFAKKKLKFKVFAIYSFDKPVKGKAKVKATVYSDEESTDEVSSFDLEPQDVGPDGTSFEVNFRNDLELNFLAMDFYIVLDVEFEEEGTEVKIKGSRSVLLQPDGKHIINLSRPSGFKPGFNFTFKATVKTRDGALEKSTTLPFKVEYDFGFAKKPSVPVKALTSAYLKNGVVSFTVQPPQDALNINFKMSYDETKLEDKVIRHESSNKEEFIQITTVTDT